MARRPTIDQAICWALAAIDVAMATNEPTRSGNITAHSRACMPPMDPPMTERQRVTPIRVASKACVRTMSRMVTTGNAEP